MRVSTRTTVGTDMRAACRCGCGCGGVVVSHWRTRMSTWWCYPHSPPFLRMHADAHKQARTHTHAHAHTHGSVESMPHSALLAVAPRPPSPLAIGALHSSLPLPFTRLRLPRTLTHGPSPRWPCRLRALRA